MRTTDFDFALPPELIAQHPASERSASRLLHLVADGRHDRHVRELPQLLRRGDLLVFNDTRVIKARLLGRKASGGKVELLIERLIDDHRALAQLGVSRAPAPGSRIVLDDDAGELRVDGRQDAFFELHLLRGGPWLALLERAGRLPLPPYIRHAPDATDDARYQTVFARTPGAVAAPTAGLHFDPALLAALDRAGVDRATLTLHVGAGTFQPVRVQQVQDHRMHAERYRIEPELVARIARARDRGGRVVAVGTTSVRALESAATAGGGIDAGESETCIFITPGYRFRVVDALLTNFHLPQSTLMMLVCAFGGQQRLMDAYRHAVAQRYRFFSYGDAMLIEPPGAAES
jgi:S-adenosylmethionine:tRNA ribosyltransferase-isomerase